MSDQLKQQLNIKDRDVLVIDYVTYLAEKYNLPIYDHDGKEIFYPSNLASSALDKGGIDLSQIDLTLKDDKYISSLNPADIKILRAAKALKEEWNSLSLLYIHELILLFKDNLASDIQNKNLLFQVLQQLQSQKFLDPQAMQFLKLIQANKPIGEIKLALYQ